MKVLIISEELRDICKQLNGVESKISIDYQGILNSYCPCLILANPDISRQISIKPYGVTIEEIIDLFRPIILLTKKEIEDKTFCLCTMSIEDKYLSEIENLLKCVKKGKLIPMEITPHLSYGKPICDY